MNGPEHYAEAERLISLAQNDPADYVDGNASVAVILAEAQVHATLALVAVTAEGTFDPEGRPLLAKSAATDGWERVL